MPRTKGSKNKSKTVAVDYAAQIAEEQAAKDAAIAELANAETAVDDLMAQLADLKEAVKAKKQISKSLIRLLQSWRQRKLKQMQLPRLKLRKPKPRKWWASFWLMA